jgi:hypothetical protein
MAAFFSGVVRAPVTGIALVALALLSLVAGAVTGQMGAVFRLSLDQADHVWRTWSAWCPVAAGPTAGRS